jgi:hypothetical protein
MADYLTAALNALKLPTHVIAGLFLCSLLLLAFDYFSIIDLTEIYSLARPLVIIAAILCGCLTLAVFVGAVYDHWKQRHKKTLLARRREIRHAEEKRNLAEYQTEVLKRLDYLSKEEVRYVANCLRKNEQSFLAYVYSGPLSNMHAKRLVGSPGGAHHQDYYPYYFHDFVWEALLLRKDEFIAKDEANKQQEEAEKRRRIGMR